MKPPIFHRIFDYDRNLLPNPHLATLEKDVKTIDQAREFTGATIGYPGWGFLYHILLSHLDRGRFEALVETGTNYGTSTIVLAQALVDAGCEGEVLSFELDPENVGKAQKNIDKAGLKDRVKIVQGDSRTTLPKALSRLSSLLRFVFLDASHLFADVISEFETVLPFLSDDALVLFDNTYQIAEGGEDQRVNGALKHIVQHYGGNLINLEFVSWHTPGLAIWQNKPNL